MQVGQQRAHLGERRVGLAELVVQRGRDAKPQLAGLGPGEHLEAEAPGGDQLGPAFVSFEQTFERRGDLAVAGPQTEQLIEVADRARVIADEILGDSGRFLQDVGAPIRGRRATASRAS